jgi:hypothetical protein
MYKIEISAQGLNQVYNLADKPANVAALKTALNIHSGDLIFPGGKKLKGEDPVPFHPECLSVKVRLFGGSLRSSDGSSSQQASIEQVAQTKEYSLPVVKTTSSDAPPQSSVTVDVESESSIAVIKGLSIHGETRLILKAGMTYGDLKRALVAQSGCEVSQPRSVKFIAKGGRTPADDEVVPIHKEPLNLRAMRTERGHDELAKKVEIADIAKRIEKAEKDVAQLRGRLFDAETTLLEARRIKHETEDAIAWLKDNKSHDLLDRAANVLAKLSTL